MQYAYAEKMVEPSIRRARRQKKLDVLVRELGGVTQAALLSGTPKSHFSAMLAGRRGVGDALAQKLEVIAEKPAGWFDSEDGAALSPEAAEIAAGIDSLPGGEDRDRVIAMARELIALGRRESGKPKQVEESDVIEQRPAYRTNAQ
jgi:hypothetical protein